MPPNFVFFVLLSSLAPYATGQRENASPPPPPPGYLTDSRFQVSPPLAIILVCLISGFFIMGCISVYVRQCFERRFLRNHPPSGNELDGAGRYQRRQGRNGLDLAEIDSFPTFVYSEVKGLKIGKAALECAVCLNHFEDDETLRLMPKCSHVFHPQCIDAWLASHVTCPVCRANLVPKPGETGLFSRHLLSQLSDDDDDQVGETPHLAPVGDHDQITSIQSQPSPEVMMTNHNLTPDHSGIMRSTGILFPRSHSTGHSLIQPCENVDRFTLRLPDDVRSQLMNSRLDRLNRSKSWVAFPRARSSRRGYRSGSTTSTGRWWNYNQDRFDGENRTTERWTFTTTTPFVSRSGSERSGKVVVGEEVTVSQKGLFKSVKSPLDRLMMMRGGGGTDKDKDNVGERSFDRLRPDDQV